MDTQITLARYIGKQLRAAREDKQLSQEDIADALGITRGAVGHIERGKTLLSLEHLIKLPRVLNKPLTYFLPNSVVTEEERQNPMLDPLLQEVVEAWPELDQAGREFVRNAARLMKERMEGVKEGPPAPRLVTEERGSGEE
jgi:transcriptional regulator with XRE-family HTH domain